MKTKTLLPLAEEASSEEKFVSRVFVWMGAGLLITSAVSYGLYKSANIQALLVDDQGVSLLGYVLMFAPLAFVLIMSFGFNRLSSTSLLVLYICYAAIMGASLSFIFLLYTNAAIFTSLFNAALMFGVMAVYGYFTKADLTRIGSFLLMALFGIIISSVVNLFVQSDSFSFVVSIISIIVFCGLTAWDIQKIKNIPAETSEEDKSKLGILGALTLYLDFINLFLSLLRLTERRKR